MMKDKKIAFTKKTSQLFSVCAFIFLLYGLFFFQIQKVFADEWYIYDDTGSAIAGPYSDVISCSDALSDGESCKPGTPPPSEDWYIYDSLGNSFAGPYNNQIQCQRDLQAGQTCNKGLPGSNSSSTYDWYRYDSTDKPVSGPYANVISCADNLPVGQSCKKGLPVATPVKNVKKVNPAATPPTAVLTSHKGIVPECDGSVTDGSANSCGYKKFIDLVSSIIKFLLWVAVPIAAISLFFAGFLYLTAGGNPGKIEEAHHIFWSVLVGIIIMLCAWLLVNTILTSLVDKSFNLLG
ncbi:MAG: pilin [Candidatus Pacebacteria bacterium]|nr:pilin [Candidatus Paceibacterota bacterium]